MASSSASRGTRDLICTKRSEKWGVRGVSTSHRGSRRIDAPNWASCIQLGILGARRATHRPIHLEEGVPRTDGPFVAPLESDKPVLVLLSEQGSHTFRVSETLKHDGVVSDVRPAVEGRLPLATARAGTPLIPFRGELERVDLLEECVDPRASASRNSLSNNGLRTAVESAPGVEGGHEPRSWCRCACDHRPRLTLATLGSTPPRWLAALRTVVGHCSAQQLDGGGFCFARLTHSSSAASP